MKSKKSEIGTLVARSNLYRVLSLGFFYPTQELSDTLERAISTDHRVLPSPYGEWINHTVETFQASLKKSSISGIESEYMKLFDLPSESLCPLYELVYYTTPHIFAMTKELADIAGFYHAFGLRMAEYERPDHISAELEFMHILTLKEAYAFEKGWKEERLLCVDAQKKFIQDHLGRWAPALCEALKASAHVEFYRKLAEVTLLHIEREVNLLKVMPERVVGRPTIKAAAEGFSCP